MRKRDLEKMRREELLEIARKNDIKGRSRMKKAELIQAILKLFRKAKAKKKAKKVRKRKGIEISLRGRRSKEQRPPTVSTEKELIEASKFEAGRQPIYPEGVAPQPQEAKVGVEEKIEIPSRYGEDRLTLLVRDPWWIFAYWEVTPRTWEDARRRIGREVPLKQVLRVYDITGIEEFTGENANSFFDIELTPFADNWYINVGVPDRSYCVELGFKTPGGSFYRILRSNTVRTPRYGMSEEISEEWMVSEEEYWRMFALSGGFGIGKGSPEMQELFKKRFEEMVSSGFPGSVFSWMQREEVARGFWLRADAELIIYGATEPDARVFVQGKPVKLRADGTFSLRFALPDGEHEIPIQAESADGMDRKQIKIKVSRQTEKED